MEEFEKKEAEEWGGKIRLGIEDSRELLETDSNTIHERIGKQIIARAI